jgi:hypothetical protein
VVGKREKFNSEGIVAVNYTEQDKFIGEFEIENIRLIRALAVLAALFHDLGKSSNALLNFSSKLPFNKSSNHVSSPLPSINFDKIKMDTHSCRIASGF